MRITKKLAMATVEKVIADVGAEHIVPVGGCVYFTAQGEPSCIVGHVLAELDLTEDWYEWNEEPVGDIAGGTRWDGTAKTQVFTATPAAMDYLDRLQDLQDEHNTWGEAHRRASAK